MAAYRLVDDLLSLAGWLPVHLVSSRPNALYRVWEAFTCFYSSNFTLVMSCRKRNVTVWRTSVCLSHWHTHRYSPGGSMQRGRHTCQLINKLDQHACRLCNLFFDLLLSCLIQLLLSLFIILPSGCFSLYITMLVVQVKRLVDCVCVCVSRQWQL